MLDWLEIARNQAEERFRSLPFPGAKDENFRFTPVAYSPAAASSVAGEKLPLAVATLDAEEAALLLLQGEEASLQGKPGGLLFTDLMRATVLGSEWTRSRIRDAELFGDDKFAQLTSARWKNGAFLHVPAGARPVKPLRFVTAPSAAEEHFRHLVVLEEGAEAVVVQESWSDPARRFVGELTEIRLGRNSKLHWVVLQHYGESTEAWLRQSVHVGEGAELRITPLHMGGQLVQVRQEVHLQGAGAQLEAQAAARADHSQHFDFWIDVRHEGDKSQSKIAYWFVVADHARAVFNAQVEVARDAVDCEASQRSRSLLLSAKAVAHAIPKLIIKTDAVKCNHGASVSSVNFEQLHYLQSRGISRVDAERMIVRGFTEPVVARLPTETLQARAEAMLDHKQGGVGVLQ